LVERDPAPELTVRVSSPVTPWLPAAETALAPGETDLALGTRYGHGGLLHIEVRAPSLPARTSRAFRTGDVRKVPTQLSGAEFQMAAYLAGQAPLPTGLAAFRLLWISAAAGGPATDTGSRALVAQECAAALAEHPAAALLAGARAGLARHQTIGVLIRAGLAAHRFARVDRPDLVSPLWSSDPLLSLLLTSPLLPYSSGSPGWDPDELTDEESGLLSAVGTYAHPAGLEILSGVRSWNGPVPAEPLVNTGDAPAASGVPDLRDGLDDLRTVVAESPFAELFTVLAHVRSAGAVSPREALLGFALVARLAAHGDTHAAEHEPALRAHWLAAATSDPGTAASDLALAEYLVSYWHAHRA
jgi:hypothetical protein